MWRVWCLALVPSLLLYFPCQVYAQVVVNKFSSASDDDWVELFNTSDAEISLYGFTLEDTASTKLKSFGDEIIPGKGYCAIDVSNRLNNKGDTIYLKNSQSTIDCVSYGDGNGVFCEGKTASDISTIDADKVGARIPNAIGTWTSTSATKGSANEPSGATGAVCYTNTPTPQPTVVYTPSPKPTPTVTVAPSTLPLPTAKQTSSPVSTATLQNVSLQTAPAQSTNTPEPNVLSQVSQQTPTQSPSDVKSRDTSSQFGQQNLIAVGFLVVGSIFIGIACFPIVKLYLFKLRRTDEV